MSINPDDVIDSTELLNELEEWVWERWDRMEPDKAALLLFVVGAEMLQRHLVNEEASGDKFYKFVESAVELGRQFGRGRLNDNTR